MASAAAAPIIVRETEVGIVVPTAEQISRRAYNIWECDGKVDGKDQQHWFQAIAESNAGIDPDDDDEEDDAAITGQGSPRSSDRMPLRHGTNHRR
jgi:hypothetical protein